MYLITDSDRVQAEAEKAFRMTFLASAMDYRGWGGTLGNFNDKYIEFDFPEDPLTSRHLYILLWI